LRVCAEVRCDLVEGEQAGVAQALSQAAKVVGEAVGADLGGGEGFSFSAGEVSFGEDRRDLSVGVFAQQFVDDGDGGVGGFAFLPGVER
jgi:hypothetical protein